MKKTDTTRKCIVTGNILEKDKLLRFCVGPDNEIIPDFKKKLSGKGVYVSNSKLLLAKAVETNVFAKALKKRVRPAVALTEMVENILRHNALGAVSLSRKAGNFVCGLDKVLEAIKKGKVAFVMEATDAGNDGHQRVMLVSKDMDVFQVFETEELEKALNRENTVHAAFLKSEMANMVKRELKKLSDFLNE
ncbi:MAG: RNA-binding protein [Alphaproteobacteria bacterium]|nr:RNA-binding protein [Alphaproteobacteria bacterium]